jgi:hypothetical protein
MIENCQTRVIGATALWWLAGAAAALCCAGPAAAELKVRVSKTVVGKWESVGITVTDPRGGSEVKPGPLAVTMADGRDRRLTLYLQPSPRLGEWSGRFTPLSTGRFTGTVMLEREHGKDLGLVPLIRVRASSARGFVRKHPTSRRVFQYGDGGTLFPIPLRLHAEDLRPSVDWRAEIARMRAHDVNFLEIPVPAPESLSEPEQDAVFRTIDRLLLEAETTGRMRVMLRLEPPKDLAGTGVTSYREQLERCAERWSYSPALATWLVAGATAQVAASERASFVRAVKAADSYRHLVAVPEDGEAGAGADVTVARQNWQQPASRYALLEAEPQDTDPEPLPGEDTWQMLVVGGIGLPFRLYRPDSEDALPLLQRTRELAQAAGKIPFQVAAAPQPGVLPTDAPGAYCRYGTVYAGWAAVDSTHSLPLPKLTSGRYELLMWDPARNRFLDDAIQRFDAGKRLIRVPESLEAVYFLLRRATTRPVPAKPAAKPRR